MAIYGRRLADRAVALNHDRERRVVDFVRCSYLGLDNHPQIVAGAVDALKDYGALHWSCARTRLNFSILGDLEAALSELFDARVITYSTVLAANMSALPLIGSGHLTGGVKPLMVFDRFAHATLAFHKGTIAAETRVETIAHNDFDALEMLCRANESVAFVCDGVYSMGGSADIEDLRRLQDRYGLFLYIDDAHGVSIFGKHGEGFARSQMSGHLGERTIIAASLGKGFGASGGLIMLGTARQEELFRRFAVAHAFSASLNVAAIGAARVAATAPNGRTHGATTGTSKQNRLVRQPRSHRPARLTVADTNGRDRRRDDGHRSRKSFARPRFLYVGNLLSHGCTREGRVAALPHGRTLGRRHPDGGQRDPRRADKQIRACAAPRPGPTLNLTRSEHV
jgi:7-keto-8-aminopelargonate synthetase-like enzyme